MKQYYIKVTTSEQLRQAAKQKDAVLLAEYELDRDELFTELAAQGKRVFLCLPDVMRQQRLKSIEQLLDNCHDGVGLVIRNLDELGLLLQKGFRGPVIADSFLYAYNREALAYYQSCFPEMDFILSDELTDAELKELMKARSSHGIYKIYGHQALMVTNQCICREKTDCKEKKLSFKDEKGNAFIATGRCSQCYSVIYHAAPTWMLDKLDEISCEKLLLDFTVESGDEMRAVLSALDSPKVKPESNIIRGHHYKGID